MWIENIQIAVTEEKTGVLWCIYSAWLGTFANDKLQPVCLSIRMYQGDSHRTDFHEISCVELQYYIYVHLWFLAIIGICKSVFCVGYALILKKPFYLF
jgi:hypothetical protein